VTDYRETFEELGVRQLLETFGEEWAQENRIGERYVREIMEASTRVNYGQNLRDMHAFGTAVSLIPAGGSVQTYGIEGGNQRIFEEFAKRSRAAVHLDCAVTSIAKHVDDETGCVTFSVADRQGDTREFDVVVVAAPLVSSTH
jgi:prenylcysteine oxidase/farnesylcysteine lyase